MAEVCVGAEMSWFEGRELGLGQLEVIEREVKRRDARRGLMELQVMSAAVCGGNGARDVWKALKKKAEG